MTQQKAMQCLSVCNCMSHAHKQHCQHTLHRYSLLHAPQFCTSKLMLLQFKHWEIGVHWQGSGILKDRDLPKSTTDECRQTRTATSPKRLDSSTRQLPCSSTMSQVAPPGRTTITSPGTRRFELTALQDGKCLLTQPRQWASALQNLGAVFRMGHCHVQRDGSDTRHAA